MKMRINKKLVFGFALALMLFGSSMASAAAINQSSSITCQGAYSVGPSVPTHMGGVGF